MWSLIPTGRRNHGRPLKRLLDTWDRNGSTSGPSPWQIYDDDDDSQVWVFLTLIFLTLKNYFFSLEAVKGETSSAEYEKRRSDKSLKLNTVKCLRIFINVLHSIIENETCKGSEPSTPMSCTNRLKSDVTRPITAYSYWLIWQTDFSEVKKVKPSHSRPGQTLRVPGGWGSQTLRHSTAEGGKVVKPTHRPALSPRKYSWYSFLLEAESPPGPYCGRKDNVNKKFQWHHR